MARNLFIPFAAAAFLLGPAMLPQGSGPATTFGLTGSVQAEINLNTSRSNIQRTKKTRKTKRTGKGKKPVKQQPAAAPGDAPDRPMTNY